MFGVSRQDLLCQAQGLTRILDFCEKNWTGSSEMWLCSGEPHMTVEALHEVTHWAHSVTAVLDWVFVFKNGKHYHAHGWMTFPRSCLWLLYDYFCIWITMLRDHLWLPSTISDYTCCLHKGGPRLDMINKWSWSWLYQTGLERGIW